VIFVQFRQHKAKKFVRVPSPTGSIEPVNDPALIPRVFVHDLVKMYSKKQPKPSVNHLNLTLYESQITALLGHNGECFKPRFLVCRLF
jgi:hypothetical protein